MKKSSFIIIVTIILMNFCACNNDNTGIESNEMNSNSEEISSTIGIGDQTGYWNAKNIMLIRPDAWKKIVDTPVISEYDLNRIDGSTATIPITAELLRQFYDYTDEQIRNCAQVWHSTTHYAYLYLIDKGNKGKWLVSEFPRDPMPGAYECSTDIIFVTSPSDEELQYAKEKGVSLDMKPVAIDSFVFITHKDNPVNSLTVQQIQDIYSGKITNWKEAGGQDMPIKAYQREPNSGSQTAMENLVMQGKLLMDPIGTRIYGMDRLVDAVAEYENGPASIGYTYNYYISNLYNNPDIKVIKVNNIDPNDQNRISSSYPFVTSYYAIVRSDEPADSPARKLRDFLLTDQGQEVIQMAGYCGIK